MLSPKLLLITEKCRPTSNQRDGGARLVQTLERTLGECLHILQFDASTYPHPHPCRFERRLANANHIAERVKALESDFTHLLFVHISMQFGLIDLPPDKKTTIWTFPMFLTPSYRACGEEVPARYTELEHRALALSDHILTPSRLEKTQLTKVYSVPENKIDVLPRGVDTRLLTPQIRQLSSNPSFCSVGSIKPQKNTLGLIDLFAAARSRWDATLRIIGPVQDTAYAETVYAKIDALSLNSSIELTGYLPPEQLSDAVADSHIHLSASHCETFGRAIFETLACGLPNIARRANNAAAEFLHHLPYTSFVDSDAEALEAIEQTLSHLPQLSALAPEVGTLYNDELLARLLAAKILERPIMAVSDFDGTLYHKDDPDLTLRSFDAFRKYPCRVVCSARSVDDLRQQMERFGLEVDYLIGYSGALIADGQGNELSRQPLDPHPRLPHAQPIHHRGDLLQLSLPSEQVPSVSGLRAETYQGTTYLAHWRASKLHATHRLLHHLGWEGQVHTFGDGPYDAELLTFFDGETSHV